MIRQFEDLEVWQLARVLCQDIYKITNDDLFSRDFRFRDQIRASSGSIMDNIAEGFERNGNKEFVQFLYIAKGSCGELRSQLHRSFDNQYITQENYNTLNNKTLQVSKSISGFIQYIKNSDYKGSKNK